jgi:PST family polysaccharide transporter
LRISVIRKYLQNDRVKVPVLSGVSTVIRMVAGLITNKVVAVLLGPAGIALVGQFGNLVSVTMTIATGGITKGLVKYTAENNDNQKVKKEYIRNSLKITFFFTSVCSILLLVFSRYLSVKTFGTGQYRIVFILFGATIFLYALNSIFYQVLNGEKKFRTYIILNIRNSIVGLIFTVLMVYLLGLTGALISLVAAQSVIFLMNIGPVVRSEWFSKELFKGALDREILKNLLNFSLMAGVSAITVQASQFMVRKYIMNNFSMSDAGIWEGINRITNMIMIIITTSFNVYYLPRLSEIRHKADFLKEILSTYIIYLPLLAIALLITYLLREKLIILLFNRDFLTMKNLFLFQFIGIFCKVGSYVLAFQLLARAMTKAYVITEIIFSILFVALSYRLTSIIGVQGVVLAFAVNYFLYWLTMIFLARSSLRLYESSADR